MSRNPMQKQKLLYLRKILLEKTDENHGLTSSEILAELALYGITAERKSLYDDLQVLEKFGMDICKSKSSTVKYYVASREFELPELKLLVDAIQSSKFITEKKSNQPNSLEFLARQLAAPALHRNQARSEARIGKPFRS